MTPAVDLANDRDRSIIDCDVGREWVAARAIHNLTGSDDEIV
jgi:hypothetical protein